MIWYACYGSNMDSERFLKYVQGGKLKVNGKTKEYRVCEEDNSPPSETESYLIKRRLYFAKESMTWDQKGVGFISTKSDKRSITFAKLYLISKPQFSHLFASENARRTTNINYDKILKNKYQDFDYNFYNRILLLNEEYKSYPIMTFTNQRIQPINFPNYDYVRLITNGLRKTHNLNNKSIARYFVKAKIGLRYNKVLQLIETTP